MEPDKPIQIDMNTPVSITLPVEQWSHILTGLDEMAHKIARPLSDKINAEILKVATPKPEETDGKDNSRKSNGDKDKEPKKGH